jgi:hypothetical protein
MSSVALPDSARAEEKIARFTESVWLALNQDQIRNLNEKKVIAVSERPFERQ